MIGIPTRAAALSDDLCRNFNKGKCALKSCKLQHKCGKCNGSHPAKSCKKPDTPE